MLRKTGTKMSIIVFMFSLSLLSYLQPVRANGTVYIRADGSIDPTNAPIERNGNVYTLTGNITADADGIVVESDDIVLDGSGYTVQGIGTGYGIYLNGRINVTIQSTSIMNFTYGIRFESSSNNSISSNNMTRNGYHGMILMNSSGNSLSGNIITNNGFYGLFLSSSSNYNSISGNTIGNNVYQAVQLYHSSLNVFLHNNFFNSTAEADEFNFWDNGAEGNYWSDYNGTDANHDGIGDSPYTISARNTDRFPLMSIIPEFPSLLILPIFIMATLLAIIIHKKSWSQRARGVTRFEA